MAGDLLARNIGDVLIDSELPQRRLRPGDLDMEHEKLRRSEVVGALGTAAAKIIHDLADPVNAISTGVQLLIRMLKDSSLEPDVISTLRHLKVETDRVHGLIKELREFSRPLILELKPVDLRKLVAEVLSGIPFLVCSKPLDLQQDIPADLPLIMADHAKLWRVLRNLCKNSVEAMPDGGRLAVRCYYSERNVWIEIQDSGLGIPKDINVFEPFTTSKPDGWGLGLSIVQQIIAAHDGSIEYSSELGKGTIFKLVFRR